MPAHPGESRLPPRSTTFRTIVSFRILDVRPPHRANPHRRPPLRGEGLPRHVDRRPRRGDGRAEGLALRAHRVEGRPALGGRARGRGGVPRRARLGARRGAGASSGSGLRCARTCASSPSSSTSRPSSCGSGATSRASGGRSSSPSAAATRSASARSSARGASSASCAPTSTTRPRRCSRSRRRTGRTPGCGRAADTDELADRFTALLLDGMRGYATPVKLALVVNPFATRVSEERLAEVRAELERVAELDVFLTERPGHATELVTGACRGGAEAVVVFSGDGGFNEALNGLESDVPIGFLPGGGTSVLLARARAAARSGRGGAAGGRGARGGPDAAHLARPRERPAVRLRRGHRATRPRSCAGSTRSAGSRDGRRPGDLAFAWAIVRELAGRSEAGSSRSSRSRATAVPRRVRRERQSVHVREAGCRCRSRREAPSSSRPRPRRSRRGRACRICRRWRRPRPERATPQRAPVTSAATTSTGSRSAATVPLPLHADGEDLGDVEQAVFEAERDAVSVLV